MLDYMSIVDCQVKLTHRGCGRFFETFSCPFWGKGVTYKVILIYVQIVLNKYVHML